MMTDAHKPSLPMLFVRLWRLHLARLSMRLSRFVADVGERLAVGARR